MLTGHWLSWAWNLIVFISFSKQLPRWMYGIFQTLSESPFIHDFPIRNSVALDTGSVDRWSTEV